MTITRAEPSFDADERAMLEGWLDYHRATLELKCEGLTEPQLKERSAAPSTLSLLGLVRHMADVERNWFRVVLDGQDAPSIYSSDAEPDGEFDGVDDADVEEAFATWRTEVGRARRLTQAVGSLDATGVRRGSRASLRWILTHMIEEYARHNGHADILRQRIDGSVGE